MVEIDKDILFNLLLDFRKRNINNIERAKILESYINETKISQRELAKELGIPHSTIQDWLLWNKIDNDKYKNLKKDGLNDTSIYKLLRNNKSKAINNISIENEIQENIKKCYNILKPFINSVDKSNNTKNCILELQNLLNRMLIKNENGN